MESSTHCKSPDALAAVTRLIESEAVTSVVDRTFPLSEAVSAIRYLESTLRTPRLAPICSRFAEEEHFAASGLIDPSKGNTMTILVTGGTGTLGRPTVELLRSTGHEVRVLSRKPGEGRVVGDLSTGAGVREELDGVGTVLHLATTRWKDAAQTRTLLRAAGAAGIRHLLFMSIVGVDRIPYAYYRDKVVSERLIAASGVPFTILRATQFHDFVATFFRAQGRLPFVSALDILDQPIAVEDVASRLDQPIAVEDVEPAGRVADIGSPEQLSMRESGEIWQRAQDSTGKVRMLRLPGKTIGAFRAGYHLAMLPSFGRETFAQFAEREARTAGAE